MTWLTVAFILGGLVALVVGGDLLVKGSARLAALLGISPIVIGLTVVAFGTSAPELAVSLKAAFAGNSNIAIANVVGSNVFNILFILGASSLIKPLLIHSNMIRREMPLVILTSLAVYGMAFAGSIHRIHGAVLFSALIFYTVWLIREARQEKKRKSELERESQELYGKLKRGSSIAKALAYAVAGLLIIIVGADWLVKGAVMLAQALGVSDTVIGLTIVAVGTSLPEVVASIMATLRNERDIAVGNVVGSCIFNILAILGISGIFSPTALVVPLSVREFDLPILVGVSVLCWYFFATGKTLSRREGGVFLGLYVIYTAVLISRAQVV